MATQNRRRRVRRQNPSAADANTRTNNSSAANVNASGRAASANVNASANTPSARTNTSMPGVTVANVPGVGAVPSAVPSYAQSLDLADSAVRNSLYQEAGEGFNSYDQDLGYFRTPTNSQGQFTQSGEATADQLRQQRRRRVQRRR